jgi:hypothetical protein
MLDDKEITEQDRQQSQAIYGTGRLVRFNERRNSQLVKQKRKSTKKAVEKIKEIDVNENVNNFLPTKEVSNDVVQITNNENRVSSAKETKKRPNKILEKPIQTETSVEVAETKKNIVENNEDEIDLEKKAQISGDDGDLLDLLPQLSYDINLPEPYEPITQHNHDLSADMSYSLPSLTNSIELSLIDSLPLVCYEPPLPQPLSFDLDKF